MTYFILYINKFVIKPANLTEENTRWYGELSFNQARVLPSQIWSEWYSNGHHIKTIVKRNARVSHRGFD